MFLTQEQSVDTEAKALRLKCGAGEGVLVASPFSGGPFKSEYSSSRRSLLWEWRGNVTWKWTWRHFAHYRDTYLYSASLYCALQIFFFFFNKGKVCGNPALSFVGIIFPTLLAHFVSLCHILVVLRLQLAEGSDDGTCWRIGWWLAFF